LSNFGFRGGVPYALDVKRLDEAFPVPSLVEGRVILHAEMEGALDMKRGAQRYYGVVNAWLSHARTSHGIFMAWEPGVGVKVLDPALILTHAETRTRQKIRQTGRAVGLYKWVDRSRLNPLGQQRLDHQGRVIGALNDAMQLARKDLAVPLAPIRSLPRRETGPPPEEDKGDKKNENKNNSSEGKDRAG